MKIKNKTVVVYDIEVFPNVFHCCCRDTETNEIHLFEISHRVNKSQKLYNYFLNPDFLFCGYNNHHYDDVIINYILEYYDAMSKIPVGRTTDSIFNLSTKIINSDEGDTSSFKRWKYAHYFDSMDLLTMLFSSKLRVGLKEMQVTMHYKNVQEYSGDFNSYLSDSDIDDMIQYNINDVDSTTELLNRCKKDIDLRLYIEEEYGFNALSMDSVKFGETLLAKKYCEETGISYKSLKEMRSPMDYIPLKDVILSCIQYKNPKFQEVLRDMKSQVVYSKERKGYEKKFVLSNVVYSIGVGGIHTINKPKIFLPNANEYIGHADVASMYPSFIVQYKFIPRHLGESFWKVYKHVYEERLSAKHSGQKLKNLALKLTLNSVTGKMQQETSWMYDPFMVFRIRINGQLVLLMLVDRLLELGCKIIQVNTDGVMYIARKDQKDDVQKAINEVEQITRLNFETDNYEAFYQCAVNDYFGVVEGYSSTKDPELIERKGMFITENKLGKGMAPVVIPKAVINYLITGQSVAEFIRNDTDIKDFLMTQRVDKKFKVEWGDTQVQRINRFYASNSGRYLYKVRPDGGYDNMLKDSGVMILNKFDDKPISERKINYDYYINKACEIISPLVHQQLELFQ